jgi:EAL domain-containing protein (putative c-di-GMP-specific phosphodiesterase class I)
LYYSPELNARIAQRRELDSMLMAADDDAIVVAIIAIAHSLRMHVIAEGVETLAQLLFLRGQHCDQIQGY